MLSAGAAFKVTVYLNRDTGSTSGFLPNDILAFLHRRGIAGAVQSIEPTRASVSIGRCTRAMREV